MCYKDLEELEASQPKEISIKGSENANFPNLIITLCNYMEITHCSPKICNTNKQI